MMMMMQQLQQGGDAVSITHAVCGHRRDHLYMTINQIKKSSDVKLEL